MVRPVTDNAREPRPGLSPGRRGFCIEEMSVSINLVAGCSSGEMPRYQCHKQVWALKIKEVETTERTAEGKYNCYLDFEDARYAPIAVGQEYYEKHKPLAGGYYVVYEGGYKSFSPADAFESGYSLIER